MWISPSRLGVYAACPRRYEYEKAWDVASPEQTRRYMDRGLALHGAIEDTCETVQSDSGLSDAEIQRVAAEAIGDRWERHADRSEYRSAAHFRYDRRLCEAAIEDYFAGDGLVHARNSVATEAWLECQHEGVALHGRVDNVVETDDGLRIIDYKSSLNGIISGYSKDDVEAHRDGEKHAPRRVKSMFQAAAYIEGLKEHAAYEPGMDIEFTYYGLLQKKETSGSLDGLQVTVNGYGRDVGWIYEYNYDAVWELITDYYEAIRAETFDPQPMELLKENACDDCTYRSMCGDYLASEVSVGE
nr:PD-(D/E)XK nuclease family protein [Halomarina salina]